MRSIPAILLIALLGVAIGGLSAWSAIERSKGLGAIAIGPWNAIAYAGISEIDPYTIAKSVIDGSVPLGATEGISFNAVTDSNGRALDLSCDYSVEGLTPSAKLWTLSAYGGDGLPAAPAPGGRSSTYSGSIVRFSDGSFRIDISSRPRPANWMAVSGGGNFRLTLRLYDTPLITSSGIATPDMPVIRMGDCRN